MEATIFDLRVALPAEGVAMERLIDGPGYNLNRIALAAGKGRGPGRHPGGAFVAVISGDVDFTIDGRKLHVDHDQLIWVPPGAERSFTAGSQGAVILAVHLPA